jgi:hypothetical protein
MAGANGKRDKYGKLPKSGDVDTEAILAVRMNVASIDLKDGLFHEPDEVHLYFDVPGLENPVVYIFRDPMKLTRVMKDMAGAGARCWPRESRKAGANGKGRILEG